MLEFLTTQSLGSAEEDRCTDRLPQDHILSRTSINYDNVLFFNYNEKNRCKISVLTGRTRSSAVAEGPRDASCQLKSCQLLRNSAETTYTTSPDQIDGMKLEI